MRLLNRLFRLEEINGRGRCPTYLYRWTLMKLGSMGVYIHHFVGNDWSKDFHDHPKRFISIGLWGSYREHTPGGHRIYRAPWIRTFPAAHQHRITMVGGGHAWTIVIVLRAVRQWGFWHLGRFIDWRTYVGSEVADRQKDCI